MAFFGPGRTWHLVNVDTFDEIEGDFEAVGVTRNVQTSYARHTSLNRQNPITQFLHGNADQLTFQARVFQKHALDFNVEEKLEKLIDWTKKDKELGRPPIVLFWIGAGSSAFFGDGFATIDSITDILFDSVTILGEVRGATFTINLTEFAEFDLEKGTEGGNTRFHKAKTGEYMELVAAREYGDPLLGDIIRKNHPDLQVVQVGDTIALPAIELIRGTAIVPRSVPFLGYLERRDSLTKDLRTFHFERVNRTFRSHTIPEGL